MSAPDQSLIEKIRQLPPQRLAEVEDFVDFLRTREASQKKFSLSFLKEASLGS